MADKQTKQVAKETAAAVEEPAVEDEGPPAWEGSVSSDEPIVAPDGHVNLSQEDIDARDQ